MSAQHYSLNCHEGAMLSTICSAKQKSLQMCAELHASLSEMGHKQRAATSSVVTDQRLKNFFVRKSSFVTEVPPNRHVLPIGDDFG